MQTHSCHENSPYICAVGIFLQRQVAMYKSRTVSSTQEGVHLALETTLQKHLASVFQKPILPHNREAFAQAAIAVERAGKPIVLDTGCGTGESTVQLAAAHPHAMVLGIDKSAHRLYKRAALGSAALADNILFVRADLVDFWRLAAEAGWRVEKQYFLYPNPWPKPEHFMRRWHGHSVFSSILALGGWVEVRSNWQLYVEEFAAACAFATGKKRGMPEMYEPEEYRTPFERKYAMSGQVLYRCIVQL